MKYNEKNITYFVYFDSLNIAKIECIDRSLMVFTKKSYWVNKKDKAKIIFRKKKVVYRNFGVQEYIAA